MSAMETRWVESANTGLWRIPLDAPLPGGFVERPDITR
jgi:hypothetical protein